EELVGFLVAPHALVDETQRARKQLERVGMIFEPMAAGEPEQAQHVHRITLKDLLVRNIDPVVVDEEVAGTGELSLPPRESRNDPVEARHVLCLFLLQSRAENAREITDDLGVQEVVLHEPLDGGKSRMRRIAEPLRNLPLNVEM